MRNTFVFLSVLCLVAALCAAPAMAENAATVQMGSHALNVQANVAANGATVRISGPGDFYLQRDMSESSFSIDTAGMTDGVYTYEVTLHPQAQRTSRDAQDRARQSNNADMTVSGYFRVSGGGIVNPDAAEESADKAQTFTTDLIVQGSACVGIDCTSSESFGSDTIRMKENNLRIHFDDTSSSASFPKNDWRIVANDSSNGGAEYLRVEDATNSKQPFTIEAGAQNHTLYVESDGDVGIKTANPVVDLHIVEGNTPTLRLEQDGSDGFTAQTWDLAGNETNFFLRDVTNSSKLSFRVKPGAPENSIFVAASGFIGMGTASPGSELHIKASATPELRFEDATRTWAQRMSGSGLAFTAPGDTDASFLIRDDGEVRVGSNGADVFEIEVNGDLKSRANGDATTTNRLFFDASAGDLTILGDLSAANFSGSSDRNLKHNIEPVDTAEVLAAVSQMPISTWSYKTDAPNIRHIGPMAQDFKAAFDLGQPETRIGVMDLSSVSLAAIQELNNQLQEKTNEVEDLKQRMEQLETALLALQQQ